MVSDMPDAMILKITKNKFFEKEVFLFYVNGLLISLKRYKTISLRWWLHRDRWIPSHKFLFLKDGECISMLDGGGVD